MIIEMAIPFVEVINQNDEQILNYCTKYLARGAKFFNDSTTAESFNLTTVAEDWRFPLVLSAVDDDGVTGTINKVIFVWQSKPGETVNSISVVGSFAPLYQSFALKPLRYDGENTGYYTFTIKAPVGKGFFYKFIVNGVDEYDRINPQRKKFANGKEWSFFFTDYYTSSEEFEDWEINLLYRLANQVVPFRTEEAQNFINRFYQALAKREEKLAMPIYKLDDTVGEVNYITNVLAREERHHLPDYKICLSLIDQLLRSRDKVHDSWTVSEILITELYNEMASGTVPGWDYSKYSNPTYFLGLIRRHTLTGAFSHPKYGGNVGGAGWSYLHDKYPIKDAAATVVGSYFNWQLALEKNLGTNTDYVG
jgi:hypothetical protein